MGSLTRELSNARDSTLIALAAGLVVWLLFAPSGYAQTTIRATCLKFDDGSQMCTAPKPAPAPSATPATVNGVPGGSNTQVQYNALGAFGGSHDLTWNNASATLTIGSGNPLDTTGVLALQATTGGPVKIRADNGSNNYQIVLPHTLGVAGQALATSGNSNIPLTWKTFVVVASAAAIPFKGSAAPTDLIPPAQGNAGLWTIYGSMVQITPCIAGTASATAVVLSTDVGPLLRQPDSIDPGMAIGTTPVSFSSDDSQPIQYQLYYEPCALPDHVSCKPGGVPDCTSLPGVLTCGGPNVPVCPTGSTVACNRNFNPSNDGRSTWTPACNNDADTNDQQSGSFRFRYSLQGPF